MNDEYGLIVSFPDQDPKFCHGFEAGMIWEAMQGSETTIERSTVVENREVIRRMAIAMGWDVETTPSSVEGWDHTVLRKVASPPTRPNPMGLRIVR